MWSLFCSIILLISSLLFLVCIDVGMAIDCKYPVTSITVAEAPGAANFTKIQDAINHISKTNHQWFRIHILAGNYIEQVEVNRPCILLEGSTNGGGTTIEFGAHATTAQSPTFSVTEEAENFVAKQINFKNTHNYAKYRFDGHSKASDPEWGMHDPAIVPAVAASVMGDKALFNSCRFYGVQDTLWDDRGRHFYQNCYFEGLVDFIWGNGQSIYENCDIVSQGAGYITAQGRNADKETTGFVFIGGRVAGINATYLGRAYRSHSRVIFRETNFATGVINPAGWDSWHYAGQEENFTYVEANCSASLSKSGMQMEKKLSPAEVAKFTSLSYVNDPEHWIDKQPH